MFKKSGALLAGLLTVAACGGTPFQGPTPASVAVQSTDLPKGLVKCDLSGGIDSFIAAEKTADPNTYSSINIEWADAKKNGATGAEVAFFADSASHCKALRTAGTDIGAANYKLVINFVIQFKDESSAAKGYTSESIFGFSAAQLKQGSVPITEGSKTGLSKNSIVLSAAIAGQSYYIAVWQNKAFMVILAVLNVDSATSKKVATAENGRTS